MPKGPMNALVRLIRKVAFADARGASDAHLLQCYKQTGDQDAFAALVKRHAPMVLGVCGRVLHDPNDIEDAFQATFLVLIRRARSISRPHLLANWLFGVARRVSLRARAQMANRRAREREVVD